MLGLFVNITHGNITLYMYIYAIEKWFQFSITKLKMLALQGD